MLALNAQLDLALQALVRNRVQAFLALLGVMVGVGALVTSLALGRGAQAAIQDQLLAAGANLIIVTSGNYQAGRPAPGGVEADHGSLHDPRDPEHWIARAPAADGLLRTGGTGAVETFYRRLLGLDDAPVPGSARAVPAHFEDDPMAVHDHPTAAERLGDSMAGLGSAATLSIEDAEAIRRELPGVQFVASGVHENARLTADDADGKQWFTRLHGTEADLPTIRRGWVFPHGRFLNAREVADDAQVMVLGRVVADRLFGEGVNPVGRTVLLWNQPFEVVGVVGSSTWAAQPTAGDDQFDAVYVPVTTVHHLLNLSKLNTITVTTRSAGETTRIAGEITDLLRRRHGITEEMPDDFVVRTQAEQVINKGLPPDLARVVSGNLRGVDEMTMAQLATSMQRSNRTLVALLAGVAAVSLLVGGIGVMNLLFLSVTQRTREIGLRMAMGARRRDIATQFFVEALVLSLIGGLLGAAAGTVAAYGLEGVFAWSTDVSPLSAAVAVAVAALLGVLSGVLPARSAARLDPIAALHHE
jgi:putative ABC transport system permease protein